MGAIGRPAAGVIGLVGRGDVFDDDRCAIDRGADDFAVARPERLHAVTDGDFGGAGEGVGVVEPWVF